VGELHKNQKLIEYGKTFQKPSFFTPAMAKQKGGKRGLSLTFEQLKDWWRISVKVQTLICEAKLQEEVRSDLRKSGNQILIHAMFR
jgi:hypothetical protein